MTQAAASSYGRRDDLERARGARAVAATRGRQDSAGGLEKGGSQPAAAAKSRKTAHRTARPPDRAPAAICLVWPKDVVSNRAKRVAWGQQIMAKD